jgi:hypothetical protein
MVLGEYGNGTEMNSLRDRAAKLWPSPSAPGSPHKTQFERMTQFIGEYSFLCHNRFIADGYPGKVYSVQYAVSPANHGSDQAGTFFNPLTSQNANLSPAEVESRQGFQSYLISFIRSGDPNKYRNGASTIQWPLTTGFADKELTNVLHVSGLSGAGGLSVVKDEQQPKERCQYWVDAQKAVEKVLQIA